MGKATLSMNKWVIIPVLFLIVLLSSYFIATGDPKTFPSYVTDSPTPTGTKAFFTYMQQEAETVKDWNRPPNLLSANDNNEVLVMIEPFFTPTTEEMEAYIDYMEAGNTILLFSENPKGFFDIEVQYDASLLPDEKVKDHHGNFFRTELQSPITFLIKDTDQPLLFSDQEGVIAYKRQYGEGTLMVSNAPEWLVNGNILKEGNLSLITSLFNMAEGDVYYFDEYLHGEKNSAATTQVYPLWFLLILLQSAIVMALFLWSQGKRFGPILVPREEMVRFSDERIAALSAWYIRSKNYHSSLVIQADYLKYLLQDKWGIRYSTPWTDIEEDLRRRMKSQKIDTQSFVRKLSAALERETLSKREYLEWSKLIDRLRKEVEKG
ncbi:DUF4350 domain-containing protein [Bacillus weihaiensis]|uniref:DUF4350 domain-containing protein n=1 Tax=Bacillus weihaiensis TaxID=1547283 RepID=UPI002351F7A0|nr:DUF4350 domain-containing protein [Bacillus weihaiensis]